MGKSFQAGRSNRNRKKGTSGASTSDAKPKFVAPTSGHEDVYFTTGSTKDAAAFQDTVQKLSRHVSTAVGWKQDPTLGKAMTNLWDPMFKPPSRTVRKYYKNMDGKEVTDQATEGTKNVKVMDDLDYAVETGEYSCKISRCETQLEAWSDNNAKGYALVLQHCPDKLQAKLKNQEAWLAIDDVKSVVRLLVLIRDF